MKTYAETQGEKPFDWNAFLDKKGYEVSELRDANELSSEWVLCACGNQCEAIPRNEYDGGSPKDHRLWSLGMQFSDHIAAMYDHFCYGTMDAVYEAHEDAKNTLLAIEKRSTEILSELKK